MRQVLIACVVLLIIGNTLTLIGLTTDVSEPILTWLLYGGPVLTAIAVIGITTLFVHLKRKQNKVD